MSPPKNIRSPCSAKGDGWVLPTAGSRTVKRIASARVLASSRRHCRDSAWWTPMLQRLCLHPCTAREVSPDPSAGEVAPTHTPLWREASWSPTTFEVLLGEAGCVKPEEGETRSKITASDLGCWGNWEWRAAGMLHLPVSMLTAPIWVPWFRGHHRWQLQWQGLLLRKCPPSPPWASMPIAPLHCRAFQQTGDKKHKARKCVQCATNGPPAAPRTEATVPWDRGWARGSTQD